MNLKSTKTSLNDELITRMEELNSWCIEHGYPLSSFLVEEIDYYKKQFLENMFLLAEKTKQERRTDVRSQIDDLNQYLEGNVTEIGLIEGLEGLLRKIRK